MARASAGVCAYVLHDFGWRTQVTASFVGRSFLHAQSQPLSNLLRHYHATA
ncbi:Uncharacterised protein [Vibrio cholerae]|nr:Uncharacterised protein [Vibrio cholerae]